MKQPKLVELGWWTTLTGLAARLVFEMSRFHLIVVGILTGLRWVRVRRHPRRVLITVQTNGMGHVVQAIQCGAALLEAGVVIDAVMLADGSKVPAHLLDRLRRAVGAEAALIDLKHEVAYDGSLGAEVSAFSVVADSVWKVAGPPSFSLIWRLKPALRALRAGAIINFWDHHVVVLGSACPSFGRVPAIHVGTQVALYEPWPAHSFLLQALYWYSAGPHAKLVPLLPAPRDDALPVIVAHVPKPSAVSAPAAAEAEEVWAEAEEESSGVGSTADAPHVVAYSCMPACLVPTIERLARANVRVILFASQPDAWRARYAAAGFSVASVEVRAPCAAEEFCARLAESSGLVASASPATVLQGLACGKPCYLVAPVGHLEQTFNLAQFVVDFPLSVCSPARASPEAWALAELGASTPAATLASRLATSAEVSEWLHSFRARVKTVLEPAVAAALAVPEERGCCARRDDRSAELV